MKTLFTALCLLVCTLPVMAQTQWTPPGPAIGSTFPDALQLQDQQGKMRSLKELMGKAGAAVFFVRSADWCPFCKRQLVEANGRLPEFKALGLNIISVSHDAVDKIAAYAQAQHIGFTMLADPDGKVVEKLGIRDVQYADGSPAYGVARPMIFIINPQGRITHKFAEEDFKDRPDLNKVLATLRAR